MSKVGGPAEVLPPNCEASSPRSLLWLSSPLWLCVVAILVEICTRKAILAQCQKGVAVLAEICTRKAILAQADQRPGCPRCWVCARARACAGSAVGLTAGIVLKGVRADLNKPEV